MTKELLQYHRQVKKALDCPKSMRDRFLADARRMTDDFLAENPGATMGELQSAIGKPDALAAMFLDSADSDAIERYRNRKSWVKRISVILLAAAFVVVTAYSIWAANYRHDAVFTKESTLIIYETEDGEIDYEKYEKIYDLVSNSDSLPLTQDGQ